MHIEPPPRVQASLYLGNAAFSAAMFRCRSSPSGVVVAHFPSQPVDGIAHQRHRGAPVTASYACTKPRIPYSAPEVPTITRFLYTSGASVIEYPRVGSATCLVHLIFPVAASSATSCASSVAMYTVPYPNAT